MSFVENALGEHERLVLKPPFPLVLRAASWGALVLLCLVPTLVWLVAWARGDAGAGLSVLVALGALVGAIIFGWTQLYMATTEVAVTSHRFIIKRGLIARFTNDLPLDAIENVDIHQGILPRLLGYGHLQVQGSGTTGLETPPMQDPVTFRTAIAESRIALQDPPTFTARPQRIDPIHRTNGPMLDVAGRTKEDVAAAVHRHRARTAPGTRTGHGPRRGAPPAPRTRRPR